MVNGSVILNWIGFAKWVTFPDGHSEGVPIESPCIESSAIIGTDVIVMWEVTVSGGGDWGCSYTVKIDYVDNNGDPVTYSRNESCEKPGTHTWGAVIPYKYKAGTYTNLKGVISNVQSC